MWYAIEGHDAEAALPKRLAVRQQHLARLHELREQGRLLLAGPCPAIDAEDPGEECRGLAFMPEAPVKRGIAVAS